ncbi:hypothetical protein RBU61_05340 [Tissierella sp. MB52-C2]|uniref:hypothetical protein n=1 Tax=Tissierella sp. MB52-C2 TaxID=3070999 RepID=UPI00280B680D|nr:hypothetical protein [Tissierella sp. MB52-C2]WMM26101.1 hypothetical protein RBU61_05340 [Tissierella sp. MB52-C2]
MCCELCGEVKENPVYLINDTPLCICDNCYNKIIQNLDNAQLSTQNKSDNTVAGTVGAFLGSLLWVLIWVVVYAMGYIAVICGIILAICIIKGYEKFEGKLNKIWITITVIMTISMVFFANYLSYGYEIYLAFKNTDNINIFEGIRSVKFFLEEYPNIKSSFIGDLLLEYFFTIIGSVFTFIKAYKTSNFKYTTRKL